MRNGAKPKANRQKRTHPMYSSKGHEAAFAQAQEDLAEFEEFKETTLKAIRKDISKGKSAKELREKYAAIVQGRLLTTALTSENESTVATLGKDIIDRTEGRATEKKEVTHKFKDLNDNELDAILKSEIEDLEDMNERFDQ